MDGGFPIDLILFGMIAAFLVLRLRSILGKRTGFERPPTVERQMAPVPAGAAGTGPIIDGRAEPVRAGRPLPDAASPVGVTLVRMRGVDRTFDPQHFLTGAESAFRMIVSAFASGDRVRLRALLADETYRSFETAIAAREAAGETQRSEVRSIESASIEQAVLDGTVASITVKFVSDQIAETLGADGRPVAGADAVAEITDIWTFTRDLTQPDPAWRLSAARSG
jgi:predicted lipid-binding transport protein (Tim44 family)